MNFTDVMQKVSSSTANEVSKFFKNIDDSYKVSRSELLTPPSQAWVTVEYIIQDAEQELFSLRISFNSKPTQYSTFLQEYAGVTIKSQKDLEHFSFSTNFSFSPSESHILVGYRDNFKDDKSITQYIRRLETKIKQGIKQSYSKYLKSLKSTQVLSTVLQEIINSKWDGATQVLSTDSNSYITFKIGPTTYNTSLYETYANCYLLTVSSDKSSYYLVHKFIRKSTVISLFWKIKVAFKVGPKYLKNKYFYKNSLFIREINKELEAFISDAVSP